MADWSWIPAFASTVGAFTGQGQQNAGSQEDLQLRKDAYARALAMLQDGSLNVGAIGPSAARNVQADPEAMLAQQQALQKLGALTSNGYNEIDQAAINRTMDQAGQQERSNREAALAHLDPGSGAAISARLQAQQSAANRENQSALDIAAAGRARALQALGAYGQLAGNMRGESFGEGMQKANAMDAISKFNAETSRFNTQNKLNALNVANGAGGNLGQGYQNYGNQQARQSVNNANAVGNAGYAFLNQPSNSQTADTSGNRGGAADLTSSDPNWKEDDNEWSNPYGGY